MIPLQPLDPLSVLCPVRPGGDAAERPLRFEWGWFVGCRGIVS